MMAEGPRNNWYSFRPNQKSCQLVSNLTYFCPLIKYEKNIIFNESLETLLDQGKK
jgi:hypothetical protein